MMTTLICNIYPLCKFGQLHVTSSETISVKKIYTTIMHMYSTLANNVTGCTRRQPSGVLSCKKGTEVPFSTLHEL